MLKKFFLKQNLRGGESWRVKRLLVLTCIVFSFVTIVCVWLLEAWYFNKSEEAQLSSFPIDRSSEISLEQETPQIFTENTDVKAEPFSDYIESDISNDSKSISIIDEADDMNGVSPPTLLGEVETAASSELAVSASEETPLVLQQSATGNALPDPVTRSSDGELYIGFVTDTHVTSSAGPAGKRTLGTKYVERVNHFITRMNNEFGADMIIANGDIIDGTRQPAIVGKGELVAVKELFNQTKIPAYWVIGNHDLRSVTKKEWKTALGIDYEYTSFNKKGYRIIILDSNYTAQEKDVIPGRSFTRGNVSEKQKKWLEKELKKSVGKSIVFIHHPPLRGLESKSNEGLLRNALEVRSLFAKYGVKAVFSGHIEDLYYEEADGVQYFSLPGLVKNPKYQGTFSEITVRGDHVEVDMSYLKKDGTYRTVRMDKKK